jgi:hypothetical protein
VFGLLLGIVLILYAGWRGSDYSLRPFQVQKRTAAQQGGRFLYLVVGLFFVVIELVYFWLGIDWLNLPTTL